MEPGRNDPCPCGSGRKYKQCCLQAQIGVLETPEALAWRRIRRTLDELQSGTTTPLAVLTRTHPAAVDEGWSEFAGIEEPFNPNTPHLGVFTSWLLYRWSPVPGTGAAVNAALAGRVPIELYLEHVRQRIDPAARRYMEAGLRASFSFHEAQRCDPGRGFEARDLFTGRERYVMERGAAQNMRTGDIVFGLIVDVDGISMLECAGPCHIPPIRKIEIMNFRKELLRDKAQCTPEELNDWDFELIDLYVEITEQLLNPRLPELRNTDGQVLEMHRLAYSIDSPEAVLRALADLDLGHTPDELLAGAERTTRGGIKRVSWTWQKAGNAMHESWTDTVLGQLEIQGRKLSAEVNSASRALELRGIIESRLGGQVRFRADTIQSIERMLAEGGQHGPADAAVERQAAELAEHPELRAALQEMMARHFESWVSESIPALEGLTPLEAVRDPEGREKVLALVIDAERHARKMNPPVDEAVLQRLRSRLGLPAEL
jgi:hypothetical protein